MAWRSKRPSLSSIDYNLLRPLQLLLEERSVSRAAERSFVSQPTMSTALARLREYFEDPLLVRSGNTYDLTPLAAQLLTAVPRALDEIERVLQLKSNFDPLTSTRTFVVAGVDYTISRLAPALSRAIAAQAPGVQLEFPAVTPDVIKDAPESLRDFDAVILPHGYLLDTPHVELFRDDWACVVDVESSLPAAPDVEDLANRGWVFTLPLREGVTPALRQLQSQGFQLSVAAVTPFFLVIPDLIAGTDRASLLPNSLALRVAEQGRVRIVSSPFGLDPIRDALWWHPDYQHDSDHLWFRDTVRQIAEVI